GESAGSGAGAGAGAAPLVVSNGTYATSGCGVFTGESAGAGALGQFADDGSDDIVSQNPSPTSVITPNNRNVVMRPRCGISFSMNTTGDTRFCQTSGSG